MGWKGGDAQGENEDRRGGERERETVASRGAAYAKFFAGFWLLLSRRVCSRCARTTLPSFDSPLVVKATWRFAIQRAVSRAYEERAKYASPLIYAYAETFRVCEDAQGGRQGRKREKETRRDA